MTQRKLRAAISQMASRQEWTANNNKAEALLRKAAAHGAELVLLQQLFDGNCFCMEQHADALRMMQPLASHGTGLHFAARAGRRRKRFRGRSFIANHQGDMFAQKNRVDPDLKSISILHRSWSILRDPCTDLDNMLLTEDGQAR